MNYIIDPKLVYLAGVSDNIYAVLFTVGMFGLIISFLILAGCLFEAYVNGEDDFKPLIKRLFIGFIVSLCMLIISSLVPNKETCYGMIAADITTKENIEFSVDALKSVIDYIESVCAK